PFYQWSAFGDTVVIRIRRLWGTTKDLVNLAQIATDFPQHSKFGRVIFDLRANSGGDDSYVYAWISEAKNGIWSSGAETRRVGDLFPCDDWNMTVIRQVLDHTVDSESARTEREKLRSGWPDRAPEDREIFNDGLITDTSQHPYGGRLYALIDRQSLSSGESSAQRLSQKNLDFGIGLRFIATRMPCAFSQSDSETFVRHSKTSLRGPERWTSPRLGATPRSRAMHRTDALLFDN